MLSFALHPMASSIKCLATSSIQTRHLFRYLNVIWNHVDEKKIKEMGVDLAAAEWIIRNGGKVKFNQKDGDYQDSYDTLLTDSNLRRYHLAEIDATEASITHHGFRYLSHLTHLKKLTLRKNNYLEDPALIHLANHGPPNLKTLEVISCADITDTGVLALGKLSQLSTLHLGDLCSVKNRQHCLTELNKNLKNCQVNWEV